MSNTETVSPSSAGVAAIETYRAKQLRIEADRLTRFRKVYSPVAGLAVGLTSSKESILSSVVAVGVGYFHDTYRRDGQKVKNPPAY